MKKLFIAFAACAMLVACGKKAATEEETVVAEDSVEVVEEVVEAVEAEVVETEAPAVAEESELPTLIDLYVKACEDENEIEATRVAKRIHGEYEEQLTANDIERMTKASAVLAEKRAEQTKEAASAAKDAFNALKK